LIGVTGSVAAVKVPELVVRLLEWQECRLPSSLDVKVVLTRGGHVFWDQAHAYDPISWDRLQTFLHHSAGIDEGIHDDDDDDVDVDGGVFARTASRRIRIYGSCVHLVMF
jgi:Flavoprotein